jgi:hypothetical protein
MRGGVGSSLGLNIASGQIIGDSGCEFICEEEDQHKTIHKDLFELGVDLSPQHACHDSVGLTRVNQVG